MVFGSGVLLHALSAGSMVFLLDAVSNAVLTQVATPVLTSAQFLIPAAVAISGIHKMMEHRETGGSFLVDMVTKGGAAGECLDLVGHRAAIVDANIANPDAWGQLNLSAEALTVRRAVSTLFAGEEVPEPVYASTPALACYPETREATEYSHLEVVRFAAYLRTRYTLVVIDLTNRIPDVTAGPEAAVAAFWLEQADVAVLPTASAKQDFNGVLDYLEVPGLPPTIVAHIRARSRRNREHPLARQYLEAIACRCARVVELPDEAERVRYAVLEGLPVQQVSPALRQAYRRLTQAVADVAPTVTA